MKQLENHKKFRSIKKFIKEFDFLNAKDLDWTLDYAHKNFELLNNYLEFLDEKAESIIKYLGLGAIIVFFFNTSFCKYGFWTQLTLIAGVTCWITSSTIALFVRKPTRIFYPPPVKFAFKYKEKYKDSKAMQARLALGYEKAMVGIQILGRGKARLLQKAYFFLVIAIILFLLSFFLRFI